MKTQLSIQKRTEYQALKKGALKDLHAGLRAFARAGEKLLIIRDERLYREEFDTWEEFCREAFHLTKTHANRLISGYNIVHALAQHEIAILPDSERLARKLAEYPKRDRAFIWKKALQLSGKKKPNYLQLQQAAKDLVPNPIARKHELKELMKKLRRIDRDLTMSLDLSGLSQFQLQEIASLFVSIQKKLAEHSVEVGSRIPRRLEQ
jgi:hypothetical protein